MVKIRDLAAFGGFDISGVLDIFEDRAEKVFSLDLAFGVKDGSTVDHHTAALERADRFESFDLGALCAKGHVCERKHKQAVKVDVDRPVDLAAIAFFVFGVELKFLLAVFELDLDGKDPFVRDGRGLSVGKDLVSGFGVPCEGEFFAVNDRTLGRKRDAQFCSGDFFGFGQRDLDQFGFGFRRRGLCGLCGLCVFGGRWGEGG